ncbi:MAG: LON peptidase substrate-binding domain-containing protein [Ardenticatenia bacterium]|nr:LON peptidase substrate-binding domain-containing protein [Ardenticatenia bacterium]
MWSSQEHRPFINPDDDTHHAHETGDYALLPIRDMVLFPRLLTPLLVERDRSIRAVEAALPAHSRLIVATQRDPDVEIPSSEDLYPIGTAVVVGRVFANPRRHQQHPDPRAAARCLAGDCPNKPLLGGPGVPHMEIGEPSWLADIVASVTDLEVGERQ